MTNFNRREIIECRNITIKPITMNEVNQNYLSWLNDSEINQYLEVRNIKSTSETIVNYINQTRKNAGCECFAIFLNGNVHIGNINITCFNPNGVGYAHYGIMIGDKKAQFLGIGGFVSFMIVEYLFNTQEIRKIECFPISSNEKSWKTTESLGFTREGVLREHDMLSNGEFVDTYAYGLFKEDWLKIRNKFSGLLKTFSISKF